MIQLSGEVKSIAISNGTDINYPKVGNGKNNGFIDIGNGSIYIMQEQNMYLFSFDETNPAIEIPELKLPYEKSIHWDSTITSQNGIGFLAISYDAFLLKNKEWKYIDTHPRLFLRSCSTFIPGNQNDIYITGGKESSGKSIYRYDIEKDGFTEPTELVREVRSHACSGFIDNDGKENLVVAGGYGWGTERVYYYNIPDNEWTEVKQFERGLWDITMTVLDGYFYVPDSSKTIIWRKKILDNDAEWEVLTDTKGPGRADTWLLPFNN